MNSKIISSKNLFNSDLNPSLKLSAEWVAENLPDTTEVMCDLCKQTFKKNDPDLKDRKTIHEKFHSQRTVKKRSQNGQDYEVNVNTVKGNVRWIEG